MTHPNLPDAASCRRNQQPILEVIAPYLADKALVLEIGSGTGQHAIYFAQQLPHIHWQTSDLAENHWAILGWLDSVRLSNVIAPLTLDVSDESWPITEVDALFTANTLHIMPEPCNAHFFRGAGQVVKPGGFVFIYGPFNYRGQFSSESNGQFELWLKQRAPHQGIRDFESIVQLAANNQLELVRDVPMPANNQLLIFRRV